MTMTHDNDNKIRLFGTVNFYTCTCKDNATL